MDHNYIPAVVYAEYQQDYLIKVQFDNGVTKTIDFACWLKGPVFRPLKDKVYFRTFFIEGGTVAWTNGADIAPETLYEAENVLLEPIEHRSLALAMAS